ncbi:MAG: hypothetical protein A3E19_04820 [Planctomycetes bacterium RIFCSPHIGHO2_12_FULL_52_36]|nr:MAG: hypothetical protein A3D89_03255 [Planctomycetes bacterium RIFCSPHIGHO2_02_FULL_52_58]OHB93397.1 MAG: hypothetical protein A3E19_04820 [Planctomycetes bacterium RIFCSPHIGHO2_12_FULL_52_36]
MTNLFEGVFSSSVRASRGLELEEIREYQAGDDLRSIDWKTSLRTRRLHVRVRLPDRRTPVLFLIDKSGSKKFGSGAVKEDVLFEVLDLLVTAVGETGNPVGFVTFTDSVERYIPPKLGQRHSLKVIELLKTEPSRSPLTDLDSAFSYLGGLALPPSLAFILSDFLAVGNYEPSLTALSKRHELIPILVRDERETTVPPLRGFLTVRDLESRELAFLDLASPLQRDLFPVELFIRLGLDYLTIGTHEGTAAWAEKLSNFFEQRARRRRARR